jgi:glycerol uptake facilitator-like aquaporin
MDGLTLLHLISIPITNSYVNPARSTGPALVVGGWALQHRKRWAGEPEYLLRPGFRWT